MIKVAVLDDYQDAFVQIIDISKYKDKFHFIGATFIISGIYLSNRKTQ